jgi:hypothetical protein
LVNNLKKIKYTLTYSKIIDENRNLEVNYNTKKFNSFLHAQNSYLIMI